mmetsp:Transcript_19483/g.62087  ORF Transcript_19483/g.62087 Transcript_19483/m.62087 type:complete len:289 (+) Transcript_19483:446-1312(+)
MAMLVGGSTTTWGADFDSDASAHVGAWDAHQLLVAWRWIVSSLDARWHEDLLQPANNLLGIHSNILRLAAPTPDWVFERGAERSQDVVNGRHEAGGLVPDCVLGHAAHHHGHHRVDSRRDGWPVARGDGQRACHHHERVLWILLLCVPVPAEDPHRQVGRAAAGPRCTLARAHWPRLTDLVLGRLLEWRQLRTDPCACWRRRCDLLLTRFDQIRRFECNPRPAEQAYGIAAFGSIVVPRAGDLPIQLGLGLESLDAYVLALERRIDRRRQGTHHGRITHRRLNGTLDR